MNRILTSLLLLLISLTVHSKTGTPIIESNFIENQGQWPNSVVGFLRSIDADFWITSNGWTCRVVAENNTDILNSCAWSFDTRNSRVSVKDEQNAKYNFFFNQDWSSKRSCSSFSEIEIYYPNAGVTLRYYTENGHFRYDIVVQKGVSPCEIALNVIGADVQTCDSHLILQDKSGNEIFKHTELCAYQFIDNRKNIVDCSFDVCDNQIQWKLENYDHNFDIVIDPIVYSTYLGGTGKDFIKLSRLDNLNQTYVGGMTKSVDFPTSNTAFDNTLNTALNCTGYCSENIFISRFAADGDSLTYSTFIGSYYDNAKTADVLADMELFQDGSIVLTGIATNHFPLTNDIIDNTYDGLESFITRLSAQGDELIFSTFWGFGAYGSGEGSAIGIDTGIDIEIDGDANIVVLGSTTSADYIQSSNSPYTDNDLTGGYNGYFLVKTNNLGNTLIFSIETGNNLNGIQFKASKIICDSSSNIFVAGTNNNGSAIVREYSPDGSSIILETAPSGIGMDGISGFIRLSNSWLVSGMTSMDNFPNDQGITSTAFESFLMKYNNDLSSIISINRTPGRYVNRLSNLNQDNYILYGYGSTSNIHPNTIPTSLALMDSISGQSDYALIVLNELTNDTIYGTFLGGSSSESWIDIDVNDNGCLSIAGTSTSIDFPIQNALDSSYNGSSSSSLGNANFDGIVTLLCNILPTVFYQDSDGDGFGNSDVFVLSDVQPSGFVADSTDCNDNCGLCSPIQVEICDLLDNNCNTIIDEGFDLDNDGFTSCQGDCDDQNPEVSPSNIEICNQIDDNCNTLIDEGFDTDNDGFTSCNGDCDDTNQNINPNQLEVCDGLDNNCNLEIDEGLLSIFYLDSDGDGFGSAVDSILSCSIPKGYSLNNLDCNDSSANINTTAVEMCNVLDDNCNGLIDEGFDQDQDGFTTCQGDCDDSNNSINPTSMELCNGVDDNCNLQIDEGFDQDNDTYTVCNGDCDDSNAAINPSATEIIDLIDNDCDGLIDESGEVDLDGDGETSSQGDCDDTNPNVNTSATEICNTIDDDCDNLIDEDLDCETDLIIPNGISPNGDGANDTWIIQGLENYPDNEVSIVNRWGQELFHAKPYLNDWDGKYQGNKLPSSDYYYVLQLSDSQIVKGFISVKE